MKLPSIFKSKETRNQEWQWPICILPPKTQSFRAETEDYKYPLCESESWFTNSTSDYSASFSGTESNYNYEEMGLDESVEMIVQGVKSEKRLFFEPEDKNAIFDTEIDVLEVEEFEEEDELFEESVVIAMESEDPYMDFKKSMEEMVETHGIKDWESLEELLDWYLKMNKIVNHDFIVKAFVDLLIDFVSSSSSDEDEDDDEDDLHEDSCFMSANQIHRIKCVL